MAEYTVSASTEEGGWLSVWFHPADSSFEEVDGHLQFETLTANGWIAGWPDPHHMKSETIQLRATLTTSRTEEIHVAWSVEAQLATRAEYEFEPGTYQLELEQTAP